MVQYNHLGTNIKSITNVNDESLVWLLGQNVGFVGSLSHYQICREISHCKYALWQSMIAQLLYDFASDLWHFKSFETTTSLFVLHRLFSWLIKIIWVKQKRRKCKHLEKNSKISSAFWNENLLLLLFDNAILKGLIIANCVSICENCNSHDWLRRLSNIIIIS